MAISQEEAYMEPLFQNLESRILDWIDVNVTRATQQALTEHKLFGIVGRTLESTDFINLVWAHAKRAVTTNLQKDTSVFDPRTYVRSEIDAYLQTHGNDMRESITAHLTSNHVTPALQSVADTIDLRV